MIDLGNNEKSDAPKDGVDADGPGHGRASPEDTTQINEATAGHSAGPPAVTKASGSGAHALANPASTETPSNNESVAPGDKSVTSVNVRKDSEAVNSAEPSAAPPDAAMPGSGTPANQVTAATSGGQPQTPPSTPQEDMRSKEHSEPSVEKADKQATELAKSSTNDSTERLAQDDDAPEEGDNGAPGASKIDARKKNEAGKGQAAKGTQKGETSEPRTRASARSQGKSQAPSTESGSAPGGINAGETPQPRTRASTRNQGKSQAANVELASASGGTGMTLRPKPAAKADTGKAKAGTGKAKDKVKGRK
ncbi:hypothetical protein BOTBODRAFT_48933 [Botryobasidium botryosum FD-172 SS1]|uniref:Uncharacterized protein n=1 Tax=Botryobasidium botryosum (strain FD-172 SS1) TaxID=930990 RepID=A0A067LY00_BOTB1|nr:hypothetical protein BOTBODRAFT_48933 [Botryobasidium botryosum FD-172 SS1]